MKGEKLEKLGMYVGKTRLCIFSSFSCLSIPFKAWRSYFVCKQKSNSPLPPLSFLLSGSMKFFKYSKNRLLEEIRIFIYWFKNGIGIVDFARCKCSLTDTALLHHFDKSEIILRPPKKILISVLNKLAVFFRVDIMLFINRNKNFLIFLLFVLHINENG